MGGVCNFVLPFQEAKEAENTCTLGDLSEGQVGKLLIRKSGKVQLVLGRVTLDVTTGTPCSFLQVWLTQETSLLLTFQNAHSLLASEMEMFKGSVALNSSCQCGQWQRRAIVMFVGLPLLV